jgi:hypothetical protein
VSAGTRHGGSRDVYVKATVATLRHSKRHFDRFL